MRKRGTLLLLVAATAMCAATSKAGIVNNFDSSAEIADWRFDYGGASQVKTFSTDDANGNASSGSMQLALTYTVGAGNQNAAFTNDEFGVGTNLAGNALDFDVKVVAGSALDAFGNNGYFNFSLRNTDNYNQVNQFGDNLTTASGWRHVHVDPLVGPFNAVRALTLQLYGGPSQDINGTVTLRIDNVVFTPVPEPTVGALLLGGIAAAARRRRLI